VALFVERAVAVKSDFSLTVDNARAVAEIISRVDGLPLAIELAASRIKLLPPERLLARLQERLPLLTTTSPSVPERQRTLRRTIEWSYELLDGTQRRVFARLAVFSGGADLDAVEGVVNPGRELGIDVIDALSVLLENNLVRNVETDDGDVRFTMLETIREYGLERLVEFGEEPQIRRRHVEYWITFAAQAAPALSGADQATWTRRVEREQENLRSAFAWALQAGDADLALRLGAALPDLWRASSRVRDGVRWLNEALALPGAAGTTLIRARALASAGRLYGWIDDPQAHLRLVEEALAIFQDLGETDAIPASLQMVGWAQVQNGMLADAAPNLARARDLHLASGNRADAAESAMGLGILELMQGRPQNARPLYEEALQTFQDLGNTYYIGLIHCMLSQCDTAEGDLAAAETRTRAGLRAFQQSGNRMGVAFTLYQFAHLAALRNQHERALRLVGATESMLKLVGGELPALVVATTGDVGAVARAALDPGTAARAFQEGSALQYEDAVAFAFQEEGLSPRRR
jgi:tetratricopeptide (TPR) repeat protein